MRIMIVVAIAASMNWTFNAKAHHYQRVRVFSAPTYSYQSSFATSAAYGVCQEQQIAVAPPVQQIAPPVQQFQRERIIERERVFERDVPLAAPPVQQFQQSYYAAPAVQFQRIYSAPAYYTAPARVTIQQRGLLGRRTRITVGY